MLTHSKLKIFLADHSDDRRTSCKHQLENMGYAAVFSFSSADACLKRLPLRPDLVFLPCPVKSPESMDLLKRIHRFDRRTMVVFTGESPEAILQTAIRRAERKCSRRRIKETITRKLLYYTGAGLLARLFSPTPGKKR
jgi:DNA-binding NtrC family response regulator